MLFVSRFSITDSKPLLIKFSFPKYLINSLNTVKAFKTTAVSELLSSDLTISGKSPCKSPTLMFSPVSFIRFLM